MEKEERTKERPQRAANQKNRGSKAYLRDGRLCLLWILYNYLVGPRRLHFNEGPIGEVVLGHIHVGPSYNCLLQDQASTAEVLHVPVKFTAAIAAWLRDNCRPVIICLIGLLVMGSFLNLEILTASNSLLAMSRAKGP